MLFHEIYRVKFRHRIDTIIWKLWNLAEDFLDGLYILRIPFAYEPEHLTLIIKLNLGCAREIHLLYICNRK